MTTHPITLEPWPKMLLPQDEVKATLQYLAHKTQKPVSFRWFTEGEGYLPQSVSVRIMVHDGLQATCAYRHVTISGTAHALAPEQKALALALIQGAWKRIADDEGQLIGCVDRNRIIIPIEITADDNDAARAILAHVVEQAIPLLDFDVADVLRDKEEEFTRQFGAAFQRSVKSRLQARQEEFDQRKRDAEQAYYTIVDFERERPVLEEEIGHLTRLAEKPQSSLARAQTNALIEVQRGTQYSRVLLDGEGTLHATTTPITIEHDGYEFPVGRYEIEIHANGDLRIKALDEHPNADHPHPHVARDGRPCLGNISADIAKLIGKLRYAETLQLLHSFLSSYNPENPYEKIGHFDPKGEYHDEDDDPCEDCDDKATPYCIFSCEHNCDCFTCADCRDLRTSFCYEECEHNQEYERFHPCDECPKKGTEFCYLKCRYNKNWELQKPCDACEEPKCSAQECPYFNHKEALEHAAANT